MAECERKNGPLVSVLISTYNRPMYVGQAIDSILRQSYSNLEIILVRDGGLPVKDVVSRFDDSRLTFIDRAQNRGLPYSFNEALSRAGGEYICYLGDDDIFYPNHVEVLVDALDGQDEYAAAYSDLYKTHCRIMPDGRRIVLSKNVEISRDFDRMLMMHFNHVLHVSLMHRRDLMDKTGPYNENLNVLIDWDLTRRLAFFTDFKHVHRITGEFYAPVGDCDRISVVRRKNVPEYVRNLLTIRTTRPAKPWPKIMDMSFIVLAEKVDIELQRTITDIWAHTFYPCYIYLPMPDAELKNVRMAVPNVSGVPVCPGCDIKGRLDAALACCQGDYVALVPSGLKLASEDTAWIEKSLYPFFNNAGSNEAFKIDGLDNCQWAGVFRKSQLIQARQQYGNLPIAESLKASQLTIRAPKPEEFPFQFDSLLTGAKEMEKQGQWLRAAEVYRHMSENYGNALWMKTLRSNALYYGGKYEQAALPAAEVNSERPTVSSLLIEARARAKMGQADGAIELYRKARSILDGPDYEVFQPAAEKLSEISEDGPGIKENPKQVPATEKGTAMPDTGYTQHYDVVREMGDCLASVGSYEQAQECYEKAAVLAPDEAGPYIGSGVIAMQQGRIADAEIAFRVAKRLDPASSRAYCGLGMIYQQQDRHSESFDSYLKSLELDKDNLTALLGLFQISCRTGSFVRVMHYLEVYLALHPGDTSVMFCLAALHFKEKQYEKAAGLLSDILALDPGNTDAENLMEEVEHATAQNHTGAAIYD